VFTIVPFSRRSSFSLQYTGRRYNQKEGREFFGGEQTRRFLLRQERVDQLDRWAIGEQGYENFVAGATLVRDSLHLSADQARLRSLISFPHLNMLL
jgi:hypothetical protein